MKKSRKISILMCMLAALTLVLAACGSNNGGSASGGKKITIGSKNFTENILLAHILADLIEAKTDIKVDRKMNLGGSNVVWTALKNNDVQLYPEYTGTIVANYYQEETGNAEETLAKTKELVKQDGLVYMEPFAFNNTYTLAISKKTADQYNLKTFSDLAKVSKDLVLGAEFEFLDRDDGYPGLQKLYNMTFKSAKGMDHGVIYQAIDQGETDVTDAYATDAQIKAHDLVILEDDKEFFPPYNAAAVIRQDTLDEYPELNDVLNLLKGQITNEEMQSLNAKVDIDGLKEEDVAHDFLVEQGLIDK